MSAVVLAVAFALLVLPLVAGWEMLVLRDNLVTHRPLKAFGAEWLRQGSIPAFNPTWAAGQPFAGNPNALPFYPGNALYWLLPFETAFHLHFVLHALLGFFGAFCLIRTLGASVAAAQLGAATFVGQGYFLSSWSFYNLLTVAAWVPWVLLGLARGGVRGLALGGLACGCMLLGGEPITAALVVPVMLVAATVRCSPLEGVARVGAVGMFGLLLALPQLAATLPVLPEIVRTTRGIDPRLVGVQDLHPARLLELFLPLPFGFPTEFGPLGTWASRVTPLQPYIFTIYAGIVALVCAAFAWQPARRWLAVAVGGLLAALCLGRVPELLQLASGGMFRYPQKFLVWYAIGIAVSAGFGLDALLASRWGARAFLWLAGLLGGASAALHFGRERAAELLAAAWAPGGAAVAGLHLRFWTGWLLLASVLAWFAGWAAKRQRGAYLVLVQTAAILQLLPALGKDAREAYFEPPPFREALGERRRLFVAPWMVFPWEERRTYPQGALNASGLARLTYRDLEPWAGIPLGLSYPLAPDLEGVYSARWFDLLEAVRVLDWEGRVPWFRRLGVEAVVRSPGRPVPGLEHLAREERFGVPTDLEGVIGVLPEARWPDELLVASSLPSSVRAVGWGALDAGQVFVPAPVPHSRQGRAELLLAAPDRLEIEVDSGGGVVVLQRAYWSLYRATIVESSRVLETMPVDFALLGIRVPPGRHRVVVEARIPGLTWAAGVSILLALGLGYCGFLRGKES